MQLVIAEKPSVARDLARVLGVRASGEHCFDGERYVITWCIGHLVELEEPAAYDARWKAWRLDTLPMLPEAFQLRAASHATAQLRAVSKLLRDRRFASVINACDAGREGELIFRYVYQYANARLPIARLWVSSLTDDAIRRGFAALRPGAQLEPLADAARSRSEADWLVGMNATRAITARGRAAGHDALYSIGRVQTPTLAMLVAREHAIRAFVARPYWEVRGELRTADGEVFTARWMAASGDAGGDDGGDRGALAGGAAAAAGVRARGERMGVGRLATAVLAHELVARDTACGAATDADGPRVERIRARTVREAPPLLFDLTSLQRTANRRFGWSAARTLELAQALYERHKVLTYPRTDSRHLSTDVAGELPAVFAALAELPAYAPFAQRLLAQPPRPGKRVIDDSKVSDHHAIIPTQKAPREGALDRDEQRLYDLVVRRFLGAFFPDAEFAVTDAWIRVGPGASPTPAFPDEQRGPAPAPSTAHAPRAPHAPHAPDDVQLLAQLPPPPDRYLARGRVRVAAGWQEVAGIGERTAAGTAGQGGREPAQGRALRDGDGDDDASASLPPLAEGQRLDGHFVAVEKQTTPPPRFTEATLLGAMETAGKLVDDEALRAAMKDRGLGTPATRAAIIETLLRRAYVIRDRQQLVPTPLGIALIDALVATPAIASLASPELTGSWEARLAAIARGADARAAFMADIARYVADFVDAIRGAAPPAALPPGTTPAQPAWGGDRRGGDRRGGKRGGRSSARGARPSRGRGGGRSRGDATARSRGDASPRGYASPRGSRGDASMERFSGDATGRSRGDASMERSRGDASMERSRGDASMERSRGDTAARSRGDASMERSRGDASMERSRGDASMERSRGDASMERPRGDATGRSRGTASKGGSRKDASRGRSRGGAAAERSREGAVRAPSQSVIDRRVTPRAPRIGRRGQAAGTPAATRRSADSSAAIGTALELPCPRCKQGTLLVGARGWGCARWREGCRLVIWFEAAGTRITPAQLRDLVTRGKTRKGTFAPGGVARAGRLVLDANAADGAVGFEPT